MIEYGLTGSSLVEHGQHVFLMHDEDGILAAALLEFVTGPGGEEDGVALLDLERPAGAVLEELAGAGREHGTLLRLLLGVVGQDDAPGGGFGRLGTADDDAISQRLELHRVRSPGGGASSAVSTTDRDAGH